MVIDFVVSVTVARAASIAFWTAFCTTVSSVVAVVVLLSSILETFSSDAGSNAEAEVSELADASFVNVCSSPSNTCSPLVGESPAVMMLLISVSPAGAADSSSEAVPVVLVSPVETVDSVSPSPV